LPGAPFVAASVNGALRKLVRAHPVSANAATISRAEYFMGFNLFR
jgi:hypothetical protein